MCGICGVVDAVNVDLADCLAPMLKRLEHRGPDNEGVLKMDYCAFGHRRLAIIDLSERGHQPMLSADGQVMVVFNGEIYNHKELRSILEGKGFEFRSRTDTEVLLHGYCHWGDELVHHLQGMFAFAIWDASRRRLLAARDPLGKKPFAWFYDGGRMLFASEITALVDGLSQRPEINLGAVEAFLRYRYVPGNVSVYKGVEKLPPGHLLIFEPERNAPPAIASYWAPQYRADKRLETGAALELLDTLLVEAVERRMESDVPLAALLSGGLDSSLIVAIAAKKLGARWKTIHASFTADREGESYYANLVAQVCQTEHEEIEISPKHADRLPEVLSCFSEPYADDSALPSYYVYAALKKHATVAISGDGGDELFAGYLHARGFYLRDVYGRLPFLAWAATGLGRAFPGYRTHRLLRHAVSLGHYLGLSGDRAFALTRSTAWNRDARELLCGQAKTDPYLERAFIAADGQSDFEKMIIADISTTLPDAYLLKVDRSSMANSVEVRCPLLDGRLLQAVQTVPRNVLMSGEQPKALLKKIAEKYLPREAIYRPKRGFSMPLDVFLRDFVPALLLEIVRKPGSFSHQYLDLALLERQIRAFAGGRSDLAYRLWSIICLEVWYRLYYTRDIDAETPFRGLG